MVSRSGFLAKVDVESSNLFSRSRNSKQKRPIGPKGLAGFFFSIAIAAE
jgi:hypothetical protein